MRDHILREIKRLAAATGKPPGSTVFANETGIGKKDWYGVYWARWTDALKEAGFEGNKFQGKHDSDALIRRLVEVSIAHGSVPTRPEMMMLRRAHPLVPHHKTIAQHFGTREELIEAVRAYCQANAEFSGLLSTLPAAAAEPKIARATVPEGWVYLLKSGQHHKIGRSDQIERRVKEITIALPESATLIHAIKTDDPAGIEAYWHRRFADRRANGEWFKLSSEDVKAFRRRTFQ